MFTAPFPSLRECHTWAQLLRSIDPQVQIDCSVLCRQPELLARIRILANCKPPKLPDLNPHQYVFSTIQYFTSDTFDNVCYVVCYTVRKNKLISILLERWFSIPWISEPCNDLLIYFLVPYTGTFIWLSAWYQNDCRALEITWFVHRHVHVCVPSYLVINLKLILAMCC